MCLRRLFKTVEPMDVQHCVGDNVAFNIWCCSTIHIKFDIAPVIKFFVTRL
jgi:hypothetical protein